MLHASFLQQLRMIQSRKAGQQLKTVTLAIILAILLLSTTLLGINSNKAYAKPAAQTLSIQSVYVTDWSQNPKTSFHSGDEISYHANINNSSGKTLSVAVTVFAYTTDNLREHIIIDRTFNIDLKPGLWGLYTPEHVPAGVTSGSYKLNEMVIDNSDKGNYAQAESGPFTVTRVQAFPLAVPYYSQFDYSGKNDLCGETSVAMTIAYYMAWHITHAEDIEAVRAIIGVSPNEGTVADQLKSAISQIEQTGYSEIGNNLSISEAVAQIQTSTNNGYPVIAFVDGKQLTPTRPYNGHWIVILGISGNTVYVNDPDSSPSGATGTGVYGMTTLSLSVYENAATTPWAKSQHQPFGISVTGQQFVSV